MQNSQGLFIVLEGSDGSGKATQFKLLAERLKAVGYEVEVFDFPRYEEPSSYFVKQYLNGAYGPAANVNPYSASLFYALDRFEAAPAIAQALESGKIVLSNRYAGSNMAHQGSKFSNPAEQRGFFVWEDSLEFNLLGIPRPSLNIFLRVPAEISYRLIAQKAARSYTSKAYDEHEADLDHLKRSVAAYDSLHRLFPKDFVLVESSKDGRILSIPAINDKIWEIIQPLLPKKKSRRPRSVVLNLDLPSAISRPQISNAGTSSPRGQAATKNLHRDEHSLDLKLADVSLLSAYNLQASEGVKVTKKNSWASSRGRYSYYKLPDVSPQLQDAYETTMARLIELHKQISRQLENHYKNLPVGSSIPAVLETITPYAALADLELITSISPLETLLFELKASPSNESRWLARQLQIAAEKANPLTRINNQATGSLSAEPEQLRETIARLVQSRLSPVNDTASEEVRLLNFWPRNEFEILVKGLYPHANLSHADIQNELEKWKYEQKNQALKAVASQPSNAALDQVQYHWDAVLDRPSLDKLIKAKLIEDLQTQTPTPRYGYMMPQLIEDAHLEDLYTECFDLSLELFSNFQASGHENLAGYATLLGHKLRSQFTTTARSLATNPVPTSEGSARLLADLKEKVAEVHPTLSQSLFRRSKRPASVKNQASRSSKRDISSKRRGRPPKSV